MVPDWLHVLSIVSLVLGFISAGIIAIDEFRHPQHMWIMNVVWPVVALFGLAITLWGYFTYGRLATHEAAEEAKKKGRTCRARRRRRSRSWSARGRRIAAAAARWATSAPSGWLRVPAIAVVVRLASLFGEKMFAVWVLDYIFAFAFGIAFQYFTIEPMRDLGGRRGLWQASRPTPCR